MSKLLSLLIPLLLSSTLLLRAQQDDLDLSRLEIPPAPQESSVPYFGVGAGFAGTFLFPDLEAANQKTQQWGLETFSQPLFLGGIEGVVTVGILPNVRVGVFGIGGSKTLQKSFSADTQGQADLALSATGLALSYALVPFRSFAILPTLAGGWGTFTLELMKAPTTIRWDDVTPNLAGVFLQRFRASYFFVQPQLYVEYAPLPFLLFRIGGGYQFAFLGSWKLNETATVEAVPNRLKPAGASAQIAIFLGLFN